MARTLKVFRTAIGFHDAYVAAPSMKAALAAWGADANLFARGQAEAVTDPKLMKAPLADPGKVIKLARGSMAEHLAALPEDAPKRNAKAEAPRRAANPTPRPSRAALDAAEDALAQAERAQEAERRTLAERQARLKRDAAAMAERHGEEAKRLRAQRDAQKARYEKAIGLWRG